MKSNPSKLKAKLIVFDLTVESLTDIICSIYPISFPPAYRAAQCGVGHLRARVLHLKCRLLIASCAYLANADISLQLPIQFIYQFLVLPLESGFRQVGVYL